MLEIRINILDEDYVDQLIVALVRQGYDVYYNDEDKVVCFTMPKEDTTELKEKLK